MKRRTKKLFRLAWRGFSQDRKESVCGLLSVAGRTEIEARRALIVNLGRHWLVRQIKSVVEEPADLSCLKDVEWWNESDVTGSDC